MLGIGQPTLHSVGGGIQYLLHPRIFFVGPFLLSITPIKVDLFPDIQTEGTEGEEEVPHRNPDPTHEGRPSVIAGDQSERSFGLLAREWFVILDRSELTGITGERGNWLCQPGFSYDVRERRVRDDDPKRLLHRRLPICMDDEGPEALEAIDGAAGNKPYTP